VWDRNTPREVGLSHAGSDAPKSLMNPLFEPVDFSDSFMDPVSLGMSKDEFFGMPNWSIQKLQCGASSGF
jgi:hypothetical protein